MLLNKIVIAEDDDAIAHMVGMALGDAGYLCIRARNGEEALQLTKMHHPDVLVLDVMMPRVDGKEVARTLKADVLLSKIPILMLTALGDVDSRVEGLDAGADDYVAKPFDLRELSARIRALVRASRRERDRNATTDLPGSAGIDQHVQELLKSDDGSFLAQVAVKGFADYARGKEPAQVTKVIVTMSSWLLGATRRHASPFLGHLGGADFIFSIPSEPKQCMEELASEFSSSLAEWGAPLGLELKAGVMHVSSISDEEGVARNLSRALASALASEDSYTLVDKD